MLPTPSQMLESERLAFAEGATAEEMMEKAGRQIAEAVRQFHPSPSTCHVFFGKGHNGGDVLVAARHLAQWGWAVHLEPCYSSSALAPLTASRLSLVASTPTEGRTPRVVLDGLLGIGASGDPREPVAGAIQRINSLREMSGSWVLAADIPSGLLEARIGSPCVRADCTVAIGFAKSLLVADHATDAVGRIVIAPLHELRLPNGIDRADVLRAGALRSFLPPRPFDFHKGMAGRLGIVAGCAKFPGAARLCTAAAVKSGAGLVTLFAPPESIPLLSAGIIPEVMISPLTSAEDVLASRFDALAIGPGMGRDWDPLVRDLAQRAPAPCVLDADALNAISMSLLNSCAGERLLTPHPGEMERLFPRKGRDRREWLEAFLQASPATLLLKGSRTIIGSANIPPEFNSTGHPGMASGGMGDVLTGVCAALIAQSKRPLVAAKIGAWVCGRAGEISIRDKHASQESLCASDIIDALGNAFDDLRNGVF